MASIKNETPASATGDLETEVSPLPRLLIALTLRDGAQTILETGPHAGEILAMDDIIPRAVATELDNVLANLEFMPLSANQRNGDSIGQRQRDLAKELHAARLFSAEGLARI